jgi:hypothetical protein
VASRILVADGTVGSASNDGLIADDDGTDGNVAGGRSLASERQRVSHPAFVVVHAHNVAEGPVTWHWS